MKVPAFALVLAMFAAADAGARGNPVVDFASITDAAAWNITHADAKYVEMEGKRAIHLVAEGDSANGIVGLVLPRGQVFSTGTIEIDLKGKNVRQRSFLGVAFNVVDEKTFEG